MSTETEALAQQVADMLMADDSTGDPWELVGYFREKLRQSQIEAADAKAAALKFATAAALSIPTPTDAVGLREAAEAAADKFYETMMDLKGNYKETLVQAFLDFAALSPFPVAEEKS